MVPKLYGYPQSANLKIIAIVLREKNVHKSPQHLEKHPFGLVPYILIPTDLKANALFEQAASIETSNFQPSAVWRSSSRELSPGFRCFRDLTPNHNRLSGQQTDEAAAEKHLAVLSGKLDVYEKILSKQNYMAGDELTLADLFHLPFATMLVDHGGSDVIEKRPNVKRWFDDMSSRASWRAVKADVKGTTA
ncbi:glutathione S-transferase [Amanita muscaria]